MIQAVMRWSVCAALIGLAGCVAPAGYAPGPVGDVPGPVGYAPFGADYPAYYNSYAINTGVWGHDYRVGPYRPGFRGPEFHRPEVARPGFARPGFARPGFARPDFHRPEFRPGGVPQHAWHGPPASHGLPFIPAGGRDRHGR